MTTPTIPQGSQYMNATLYTGTGASLAVTNGVAGQSFQPDLVWIKSRSAATDHKLTDSVRGVTKALISDTTGAETTDTNGLTAFGTGGFTVGSDTIYNNSGATYVGWQWKAGGTAVSNTAGSITSSVSANTTSGFSIVTYTGTGVAGTIGHGLGVAPQMIIVKPRSATVTTDAWNVYHVSTGNTQFLVLNATDAAVAASNRWNNTSPTSSVFSIGTVPSSNAVGYVAYCWAPVAGFSQFGSYTGNGSTDGPFVSLGFRPKWILWKNTSTGTDAWYMYDSVRQTYNAEVTYLSPTVASAEGSNGGAMDFLSNGVKIRNTGTDMNSNTAIYIYAAFAENPFKYANAR
jgi:hypothetical protein